MTGERQLTLLAPAGGFDSLAAALRGGADAVYFGVGDLNMRSRSTVNFSAADLPKVVRLCRKAGAAAYLTLNIIVYDHELAAVRQLCEAAKAAGVDAVIASDFAVMNYARSIGLPVHVSVQCNVCNLEAVRFYAQFADVLVLARELSLKQISDICRAVREEKITGPSGRPVGIEIFIHGALCVAVSGKCQMSLAQYRSSANRGGCFQNCRRKYLVADAETGEELLVDNQYVMSPKDLCTLPFLSEILESGVSVLKIEGRGRSADYVARTVGVYRRAVDRFLAGTPLTKAEIRDGMEELQGTFNRGFWCGGYYLGEALGEWCGAGGSRAGLRKVLLGRITGYYAKIGVAEASLDAGALRPGELLLVTGNTTGALEFTPAEIRLERDPVPLAEQGSLVAFAVPRRVRAGDKLFKLVERRFGEADEA